MRHHEFQICSDDSGFALHEQDARVNSMELDIEEITRCEDGPDTVSIQIRILGEKGELVERVNYTFKANNLVSMA